MGDPRIDEGTAEDQISYPTTQRFEGGVGWICPQLWHLAVQEGMVDGFQYFAHHHETFDSLFQLFEGVLEIENEGFG
jgi:hypothetical protein